MTHDPDRPAVDPALARLRVYQEAVALSDAVSAAVLAYPAHEHSLASQSRRAGESVYANIAEGHGRRSRADKARFFTMASSSLAELRAHLDHALATNALPSAAHADLRTRAIHTNRLLSALRRSLGP